MLQQCTTRQACITAGRVVQGSLCLITCTNNQYLAQEISTCYDECPLWLGYAMPVDDSFVCSLCTTGQFATLSGCASSCGDSVFALGCYPSCPPGSVDGGATCTQASNMAGCTNVNALYFANLASYDEQQYFNVCLSSPPSGMY